MKNRLRAIRFPGQDCQNSLYFFDKAPGLVGLKNKNKKFVQCCGKPVKLEMMVVDRKVAERV